MSAFTVGFIGGGRVARIILGGWARAGFTPGRIVIADPNPAALASINQRFPGVETSSDITLAAAQDLVILATHPPVLAEALAGAVGALRPSAILLSLAPKFTLAKLATMLGGFTRIARSNPNAASLVGAGMNPVAFDASLGAVDRTRILALLSPLGLCPVITEEKIEAYAVFTAMGPTYLWFQLQQLRELAVSFGLDAREADEGLRQMVTGATSTLLDSGLTPAEVMDLVPVKPLAEMEPQVLELYRTRIPALFQKIKP